MKIELTDREWNELQWFIHTVQGWNEGGPYGDGGDITEKKGYALMTRIQEKIRLARRARFEGSDKAMQVLNDFSAQIAKQK